MIIMTMVMMITMMRMMAAVSTLMMMRLSTAGIIVAPPCESNDYFLRPVKDSYHKKCCSQKEKSSDQSKTPHKKCCSQEEKSGTILEVSFPTEIRYRDSVDNLNASDSGDS